RDRLLRAWLGSLLPVPVQITRPPPTRRYEWLAYAFPASEESLSPKLEVVGVFAFPRSDRLPLAMGFAARTTRRDSLAAASAEALQQLAFLWGLPVSRRGTTEKPSPRHHLETYQRPTRHRVLRAWLAGEHAAYAPRRRTTSPCTDPVRFIDLTPPWLAGKARVAKAVSAGAVPFGFGELPSTRCLPLALRLHPIP
ncbi:MAG: hypothetical protein K0S65_4376, partial [Labilithrix sp.]|nr:hypothetical protein [Labilithrix sp.]